MPKPWLCWGLDRLGRRRTRISFVFTGLVNIYIFCHFEQKCDEAENVHKMRNKKNNNVFCVFYLEFLSICMYRFFLIVCFHTFMFVILISLFSMFYNVAFVSCDYCCVFLISRFFSFLFFISVPSFIHFSFIHFHE